MCTTLVEEDHYIVRGYFLSGLAASVWLDIMIYEVMKNYWGAPIAGRVFGQDLQKAPALGLRGGPHVPRAGVGVG